METGFPPCPPGIQFSRTLLVVWYNLGQVKSVQNHIDPQTETETEENNQQV